MYALKIQIIGFISGDQPGFVACTFSDAWNKEHIIHEKIPVVTQRDLQAGSDYPQEGTITCEIMKEWKDPVGRTLYTISTGKPWAVETIAGMTRFDVEEGQLILYGE